MENFRKDPYRYCKEKTKTILSELGIWSQYVIILLLIFMFNTKELLKSSLKMMEYLMKLKKTYLFFIKECR